MKTLTTLTKLYYYSRAKDCSNYNRLWLELWWVTGLETRPENFGSSSYFSKFERCNQLEPEHFIFHSMKPLVAIENLRGPNLLFFHFVLYFKFNAVGVV
jgi:hypothetical protein